MMATMMATMTAAAAVAADGQRRLRCSAGARRVAGGGWRAATYSLFIVCSKQLIKEVLFVQWSLGNISSRM